MIDMLIAILRIRNKTTTVCEI